MTAEQDASDRRTAEMRTFLTSALRMPDGSRPPIQAVLRATSEYQTSHELEEITVTLADGRIVPLVLKHLGREHLHSSARQVKPEFLYDVLREFVVYEQIVPMFASGPAHCYAADRNRGWLFLEKIDGVELYQRGDVGDWCAAAAWLARAHAVAEGLALADETRAHLLQYDERYYRRWLDRAVNFTADGDAARRNALEQLTDRWAAVISGADAWPSALLHGEFYASNVLISETPNGARICPIDWEMAGIGPPLIDLAALIAGDWSDTDRDAIARAYLEERTTVGYHEFLEALRCCEILVALQWLGWAREWQPPAAHRRDWARTLAQLLVDV